MREYIISIVAISLFCGVCNGMLPITGKIKELIRFITGIIMLISFIAPFRNLDIHQVRFDFEQLYESSDIYTSMGEETYKTQMTEIIKQRTEAYILDKALSMDVQVQVEVALSQNDPPVPVSVTLRGQISPYTKQILIRQIEQDLGIPEEKQIWM